MYRASKRSGRAGPWAGALVLALWISLCCACGDQSETGGGAAVSTGANTYSKQNCVTCHGTQAEGTSMGPALAELSRQWTRQQLIEYFGDPKGVAAKMPHLGQKQWMLPMPAVEVSDEEKGRLADYVLGL